MPKRTTAQKLEAAEMFWRRKIQTAYEDADKSGEVNLPFQTAVAMVAALMSKYANEDPRGAAALYDELTRTLVTQVSQVRARVAA
jgi:hypothetical protein